MSTRLRYRQHTASFVYVPSEGDSSTESETYTTESMTDVLTPGKPPYTQFNGLYHSKVTGRASGVIFEDASGFILAANAGDASDVNAVMSQFRITDYINFAKLDFQKNNSFELIPALFDLDGTIAMFAKKFWKQISYGAVNWGLLPFISDLKSLFNTVQDLGGRIGDSLQREQEVHKTFPITYFSTHYRFTGKLSLRGTVTVVPPDWRGVAAILLDELGVHPDLKTVWDVIPLSFVADYFLPVGDYLESVHPRGWYQPEYRFQGSSTVSGNWSLSYSLRDDGSGPTATGTVFERYNNVPWNIETTVRPKEPEWKAPNARELFNTAYLARSRVSR